MNFGMYAGGWPYPTKHHPTCAAGPVHEATAPWAMSFAKPDRTGSTSLGPGMGWRTGEHKIPKLSKMNLQFFFQPQLSPCLHDGFNSKRIEHVALLRTCIHPGNQPDGITRDGWTLTRLSPMATQKKTQTIMSIDYIFFLFPRWVAS